jgi:hypothetical protein
LARERDRYRALTEVRNANVTGQAKSEISLGRPCRHGLPLPLIAEAEQQLVAAGSAGRDDW